MGALGRNVKKVKYLLGFLLGVGLVVIFLWNTDLPRFWAAIRGAHRGYLAGAVALTLLSYVLRAIRWHYLVRPIRKASFPALFEGIVVGFTVSNLLPGKLGEVVRPYIVAVRDGFKVSALFATVVMDRIFDALAVVMLMGIYLLTLDAEHATPALRDHLAKVKLGGVISLGAIVCVLAALWLLRFRTQFAVRVARILLFPLPERIRGRLLHQLEHFAHGLSILSDARGMTLTLFWSVVVWVEIACSHYLVIRSFGIQLPFVATFLLVALMVIGISAPTPGGMGGLQWACKLGLLLTASPAPEGAVVDAASMAVWGNSFLPVTLLGIVYLWKEGLSLGKIEAIADQPVPNALAEESASGAS